MPPPVDLRRRNALWQRLRGLLPGTHAFEAALHDLGALTGWNRVRVLAALGLSEAEVSAADPPSTVQAPDVVPGGMERP